MNKTVEQKIEVVLFELSVLHQKLDALLECLVEEGDEDGGDEFGAERNTQQTL